MSYNGPNRRVHTTYLSRNREYHVCKKTCVAVRDRQTNVWMSCHEAIGMVMREDPTRKEHVGYPITFASRFSEIRTSIIVDILRPGRTTVAMYGLLWAVCPAITKNPMDFSYQ